MPVKKKISLSDRLNGLFDRARQSMTVTPSLADVTNDAGKNIPMSRRDKANMNITLRKDKILQEGSLHKSREFFDPSIAVESFGLKNIQFGNWMNEQERQEYLYAGLNALDELAKLLKVSRKQISLGGRLSLSIGGRGNGGRAHGHYESIPYGIINLPKSGVDKSYKGIGSVAHEWAHAIDNLAWQKEGGSHADLFASSGNPVKKGWTPLTTRHEVDESSLKGENLRALMEQLFAKLYWKDSSYKKKTKFHESILLSKSEYLNRRIEVWARTFEAWCRHIGPPHLSKALCKSSSRYNTNYTFENGGSGRIYPDSALLTEVTPIIWKIIRRAFNLINGESVKKEVVKREEPVKREPVKKEVVKREEPVKREPVKKEVVKREEPAENDASVARSRFFSKEKSNKREEPIEKEPIEKDIEIEAYSKREKEILKEYDYSIKKSTIWNYIKISKSRQKLSKEEKNKIIKEIRRKENKIKNELDSLPEEAVYMILQQVSTGIKREYSHRRKKQYIEDIIKYTAMGIAGYSLPMAWKIQFDEFFDKLIFGINHDSSREEYKIYKGSKFDLKNIIIGEKATIASRQGTIEGYYAIMDLNNVIASNDYRNFKPTEGYPLECQQRDYTNDKQEQNKVRVNAVNFDARFLLSDDPTAGNGPPIVRINNDGTAYVLGGNSRTMIAKILADRGDYDIYKNALLAKAKSLSFNGEDINKFSYPLLVRAISADLKDCASISRLLNANLTQELDEVQESVKREEPAKNNAAVARSRFFSQEPAENDAAVTHSRFSSQEPVKEEQTEIEDSIKHYSEDDDKKTIDALWDVATAYKQSGETSYSDAINNHPSVREKVNSLFLDGDFDPDNAESIFGESLYVISGWSGINDLEYYGHELSEYRDKVIRTMGKLASISNRYYGFNIFARYINRAFLEEIHRRKEKVDKKTYIRELNKKPYIPYDEKINKNLEFIWDALDGSLKNWEEIVNFWYVETAKASKENRRKKIDINGTRIGELGINNVGSIEAQEMFDRLREKMKNTRNSGLSDGNFSSNFDLISRDSIPQKIESDRQRYRLSEIRTLNIQSIPLNSRWQTFLGALPVPFRIRMWGTEGSGKSTLALELADVIGNHNPRTTILYAAFEEGARAGGFSNRAETTSATAPNVYIMEFRNIGELSEEIAIDKPDIIIIDSTNAATEHPQSIIELIQKNEDISFILVQHAVSDGTRAKGSDIGYYVDTSIHVKDGIATTSPRKNRFGKPATMNVFQKRL